MDQQLNQDLRDSLISLGISAEAVESVIADVHALAMLRALDRYVVRLPEEVQAQLKATPPDQLEGFLKAHADILPKISEEDLQQASRETWKQYLRGLKDKK